LEVTRRDVLPSGEARGVRMSLRLLDNRCAPHLNGGHYDMTKRTIPEIRELIYELTAESQQLAKRQTQIAKQITKLAQETTRRSPVRYGPRRRRMVTPAIVTSVKAMAAAHPNMLLDEIAQAHNIDGGRVSEILAGKRGE